MTLLNLIVCVGENFLIGDSKPNTVNGMSWHVPSELKNFKNITDGNVLFFGKTTASLAPVHKMKNRIIEVLDFDVNINELIEKYKDKDIFVCGGFSIYNYFIENYKLDNIYISFLKPSVKIEKIHHPLCLNKLETLIKEYPIKEKISEDEYYECYKFSKEI